MENNNSSPLLEPVIKRNVGASFEFLDDYDEDEEFSQADSEKTNKNETKSPKEFNVDAEDIPEFNESDFDDSHAQPNELNQAQEKNRKLVAKTILDLVAIGVPKGVQLITALPETELKSAAIEAERKGKPEYKKIFEDAIQKNIDDNNKITEYVRYFTVQMEEPLRQVMGNKSINITPEQQLIGWGIAMTGTVGYLSYEMSKTNASLMQEIRLLRNDLDSIDIEKVKQQPANKTDTPINDKKDE